MGVSGLFDETLQSRHFFDHPAVGALVIETIPPRMFRRVAAKMPICEGARLPGLNRGHGRFFGGGGPGFESGKVIPDAHQLDVYPVAAELLDLKPPANIASDGGALRAALRKP